MSYARRAGLSLNRISTAFRGARAVPRRTIFGSSAGHGDADDIDSSGRPGTQKVPLDPEWVEIARKQLKGADPEGKLTWRTPEVG